MKKLFAILLSIILVFSIVGCGQAKPIESAEDLIGVWKVVQPLTEYFTEEYCEKLGVEEIKTTAVYEWHIELHSDGTTNYVIDYDLNKESRQKSHYVIFYDIFTEAKKLLSEDEFMNLVEDCYGYKWYKKFLDENTVNEYSDSEHYEGYKVFFEEAKVEVKKYVNAPIEEQIAIGAMWYGLLEDIGTRFVYKDGEWQPLASVRYNWSFENGTFRYDVMKHQLEGTTKSFTLNGEFFENSTWTRVE